MVKEMFPSWRENPSAFSNVERNSDDLSCEEEKDDEDMEILSSDEDTDIYKNQETTPGSRNLIAHNKNLLKKTSSQRSKRAKWVSP